ncbi:MAG TPA: D-2-hydroxyacid dehydrogenase [Propionibacteriaceae bacterium]|nr:D-2-hydroxyacid dehydrogenase [Propionibacteriaceae bacterium]
MSDRLRVVVATPLTEQVSRYLSEAERRFELVHDPALLPPMRHPADHAGDPSFRRRPDQQRDFEDLLDSADVLYGIPDGDSDALKRTVSSNPDLRWVHTMAAGGGSQVKAAELTSEQLDRVVFTTSAGVHAQPLAEFALFGLLAGAKNLDRLQRLQLNREWPERWMMGQLAQQTVLVVGLGAIGRRVAEVLAALGATVIGTSRHETSVPGVDRVIHPDRLAEVASQVAGVVTTLPGTDATRGLLGAAFFGALQTGATVVNVGRGTVIQEEALIGALNSGIVGYAALDVFATEPLPAGSPLWHMPNVIISPHTAALSAAEDRLIAELFVANAARLLDGEELLNQVDTVEFY